MLNSGSRRRYGLVASFANPALTCRVDAPSWTPADAGSVPRFMRSQSPWIWSAASLPDAGVHVEPAQTPLIRMMRRRTHRRYGSLPFLVQAADARSLPGAVRVD